jgi:hypothetical protein
MTYLLLALATWRISSLLVHEEGPFRIFERLRRRVGLMNDVEIPDGFLPGVLSCVWCASLWVGAGWALVWLLVPDVVQWLSLPFALSALAICFEKLVKNGD